MARIEDELITRRRLLHFGLAGLSLPLVGCGESDFYGVDVDGVLPDLSFRMTRARDGKEVTEADCRGQVVALFFGYTYCPDICPMTLANLTALAERMGEGARRLSILFVTVDPERDTLPALADYMAAFSPRVDGLRGTANQLARLTRRFKVTYKVASHAPDETYYAVSHGKSVYVFDGQGEARVMWPEFDTSDADIAGAERDLSRVLASP